MAKKKPSGGIKTAGAFWPVPGTCEGEPLDIASPSVGDMRPMGRGLDEDERYNKWLHTRLREVWPLDLPHELHD
jgi:hypothetical protein